MSEVSEELKRCPCCGKMAILTHLTMVVEIECPACALKIAQLVGTTATDSRAIAERSVIAAWNRRAIPPAPSTASEDGLPPLPEPLDIDWPELNSHALGCGVEDRGIRDRYSAAEYGWDNGFSGAVEAVPEEIYSADQMRDYARAALAAKPPEPQANVIPPFAEPAGQHNASIAQLLAFYQVETLAELVEVQATHVEKLQKKLAAITPKQAAFTRVREG